MIVYGLESFVEMVPSSLWVKAMDEDILSLYNNET